MDTALSVPTPLMPGRNGGQLRRGGGRPPMGKEQVQFMAALRSKAPAIAEALVKQALKGNVRAMELALAYIIGKPTDKVELSGPDGGPITTHAIAHDDHEVQALRDAIKRELARQHPDGAVEGDPAEPAVAGAAP